MTGIVAFGTADDRTAALSEVAAHLRKGGIVVYPTETVYGLGCALDAAGLDALVAFKGRRPFLLLIPDPDGAPGLHWTDDARRLAASFWPGPLTLALTAEPDRYPDQVVGPDGAVAVRVSSHPGIPALLDAAAGPITSTSANRPGRPPARDPAGAADVAAGVEAAGGSALVLDGGRLPEGRPSTIVRCGTTCELLREGAIPRAALESVVELE